MGSDLSPVRRRILHGDVVALILALGGNASVPALYDTRYNVTVVGGAASQWDDARGTLGFGPSLVQATASKRPAVSANGSIVPDGVDDELVSPLSSVFDLSAAFSFVMVAALPQSAGAVNPGGLSDGPASNRYIGIFNTSTGTGTIRGDVRGNAATTQPNSTVLTGPNVRLIIVSKTATTGVAIDVPSHVRVSATATASGAAGANQLSVGSAPAASNFSTYTLRAVLCLARQATAGDITLLLAWAQTYHGAVAAA